MGSSCFGDRVRDARKRAGLTQEQLAERVGVHVITANRWEASGSLPKSIGVLGKIADALNVHSRWLEDGTGPMRKRRAA